MYSERPALVLSDLKEVGRYERRLPAQWVLAPHGSVRAYMYTVSLPLCIYKHTHHSPVYIYIHVHLGPACQPVMYRSRLVTLPFDRFIHFKCQNRLYMPSTFLQNVGYYSKSIGFLQCRQAGQELCLNGRQPGRACVGRVWGVQETVSACQWGGRRHHHGDNPSGQFFKYVGLKMGWNMYIVGGKNCSR